MLKRANAFIEVNSLDGNQSQDGAGPDPDAVQRSVSFSGKEGFLDLLNKGQVKKQTTLQSDLLGSDILSPTKRLPSQPNISQTPTMQPAQRMASNLFGAQPQGQPPSQTAQSLSLFGQTASQNKPAASGSLFGQQNTPAGGGSLFGQQAQPSNLFGGGNSAANTQKPGLFGGNFQTPQKPPAQQTSLFGAQGAPQGQTNMFGQPQAQGQPAANSLFGQSNQPGQQPQPGGLFQSGVPQFGHPVQQTPVLPSHQLQEQGEVNSLIQVYADALDPNSSQNHFRGCLFNKVDPRQMKQSQVRYLAQHVPPQVGAAPVDLHKWLRCVEQNPTPHSLVPTQVASVAELKTRAQTLVKAMRETRARLARAKEHLEIVQTSCEAEASKQLELAHSNNTQIRSRLTQVFVKMERVLTELNRVSVERRPQEDLLARQRALLQKVADPQTGLARKAQQLRTQTHQALSEGEHFRDTDTFDGKLGGERLEQQQVADADLRDILRVLKSQKEGLQVLQTSMEASASQLNVMDTQLNI